jgi:hypothetical protein
MSTGMPYAYDMPIAPPKHGGTRHHRHYLMTTPTVAQFAKLEFFCPNAEGIELYSNISYWAKRIMHDELMVSGTVSGSRFVSKITLAAMFDTGWYNVNLDKGAHVVMGRGSG